MDICVTGASQGLGLALTKEYLQRGHRVWAVARTTDALVRLAEQYQGRLFVSVVDIAEEASLRTWQTEMATQHFTPACAVLNASVLLHDCKENGIDMMNAEKTIAIDLLGTLRTAAMLLPPMLTRKNGSLVFVSSTASRRPVAHSASYAASKAGLSMAVRSLRLAYAQSGVRFADIVLGPIQTEMWEGRTSILVPSTTSAAKAIASFSISDKRTLFYPTLSTTLLRLSLWMPDKLFSFFSSALLK